MKNIPFALIRKKELNEIKENVLDKNKIIRTATEFVKEIENGNLDVVYKGEEQVEHFKENSLAVSLISMRNQMKKIAQEESERNWVTEGLAQFVEILRSNSSILELSDNIIKSLVQYLKANQGVLFLLVDENPQDVHLQVTGCFAYDRKKFIEKRFHIGEGLAGQSVLEKETIYLTDVPQNYLKITSGLGEALPKNILIVPLKVNDKVYGIVEIASFSKLASYQIEFVEKLSESIASSIASVRTNERTRKLLEETQMQAEQMRAQEEEMRQNMEELAATQEEMQRSHERTGSILNEIQEKESYLNNLINATNDSIIAIDTNRNVVIYNKAFSDALANNGIIAKKGMNILEAVHPHQHADEIARFDRIFNGESIVDTNEYYGKFYRINSQPLRNTKGEIIGSCTFTSDVTEQVLAQKRTEELLNQATQQTEELQSQEEEMRQNLEELSAIQEEMQRVLKASQDNEAYLQSFINASHDSIVAVDKNLNIVSFNSAMQKFFQSNGGGVKKGDNMKAFLNQENIDKQLEVYHRVLKGEHHEATKQYGDKILTIKYDPIRNITTNEIIGVCCFTRDVTEQLTAQKQIETLKRELEAREEVFGLATIMSESDSLGNITFVNDKLCKVSKYSKEELVGKPHNIFRHPDMPKELFKLFWKTIQSGESFRGVIKNKAKDGSHYWVDAAIVPIKDEEGKILKYIGARYHIADDEIAELLYERQAKKLGLPSLKKSK